MLTVCFLCWAYSLDFLFLRHHYYCVKNQCSAQSWKALPNHTCVIQVRNKNGAITMLSRSKATLAYPFHPVWLPPLNYSLQSAAFNQRGMAGMAHGVTPTRLCCQLAIVPPHWPRERAMRGFSEPDQAINKSRPVGAASGKCGHCVAG